MVDRDGKLYFRVAVPLPLRGTFTYKVPDGPNIRPQVGCRVVVPFKNRKVTGYVLEESGPYETGEMKEIEEVLDHEPVFAKKMVPFFEWLAEYYFHPVGLVIQSTLPSGLGRKIFKAARITEAGRTAIDSLPHASKEREILCWIRDNPGKRLSRPLRSVYPLHRKGWVDIEDRRSGSPSGPLMRKYVRAKEDADIASLFEQDKGRLRARNEEAFLEMFLNSGAPALAHIGKRFSNGRYLVDKWVRKGFLECREEAVYRDVTGNIISATSRPEALYDQQARALERIKAGLDTRSFSPFLLYGVTGSGKTEVYCRASEHAIRQGRKVIIMVPEIALAVYLEGLLRSRLEGRIAVYHSGLSEGERYDQWMRMVRGEVDLVIGARSALFAPFSGIGLIIVDEEHDWAYKQEQSPHYQARDAAVVRARMEKAAVVLGSGTPSVQSFQNTVNGKYDLLTMPERVESRPLPRIDMVDMKSVEEIHGKGRMLSPVLKREIAENLRTGQQSILFLNRRGYHRLYICAACGETLYCPNCDVALTYHLEENRLYCHYCGYSRRKDKKCAACGRERLRAYGFGTEKLEHELRALFPEARLARMDMDTARQKGNSFKTLKEFAEHKTDILVGTQMITKGYDFPEVTLVGVIAADLSLGFPDFRGGERTFQILCQVAGRAGRGDQGGRVVVQAFNKDHYAIEAAIRHDYQAFFERERSLRQDLGYPPFSYLASLKVQGNNKASTDEAAMALGVKLRDGLRGWKKRGKDIRVLGPAEAAIPRLKGKYRRQLLIKCSSPWLLQDFLGEVDRLWSKEIKPNTAYGGVRLIMDVDPYQMN